MDVRYLILSLFFLVSCMPTADVGRGQLSGSQTTSGSEGGSNNGEAPVSGITWNYLGSNSPTITINVSNLNNAYLIGTSVEAYLASSSNFTNANYCLVTTYNLGGVPLELRSRVIPISYYDFNAKRTVKILRVDFQDVTNSSSFCNSTLRIKNSNGDYVADSTSPPTYKFDPNLLCPTCTSVLQTTRVRLFQKGSSFLDEVSLNQINTANLSMQVDPNYSVGGGSGSCTNSACQSRGFDCCLDNQCVNDGATRPSAYSQYPQLLQTAEAERIQNPLAYLNYPQLYYLCGITVPPTTSGGSGGGYDEGLTQLKKDYYCVQHIKGQTTSTPFHNDLLNLSFTPATDCLTASGDSSQTMYYQNVMKRLYTTCGCSKTQLSEMITSCPAYDYTVSTYGSNNEPLQIDCYTPPTEVGPTPIQQSVSVPSRSAPHRFFESINGLEKNILGSEKTYTLNGTTLQYQQEGDAFSYLDETMVLSDQRNFSMNAILGQMTVSLDKALPAKTVNVELDQVYILSTTSGYYTPCPTCGKDSWLNTLSAFPSSSWGTGLQAIGHTTSRDSLSTNTTGGNYEDTIFGRACWLPPTMIPFTHVSKASTKEQRLNRLQAQAALFANGYQRDWFGFNKGALIGSFDGVTWFAVGKGRIVRSTSKKLFLAINAPFADLANPSMHVVNVQAYDGITQAAQVDYDPAYHQYHPYQNEAGNCQKYHMCSTDTDCVTKLGWEYACADVTDLKTKWPSFNSEAQESGTLATAIGLDQILHQKRLPSSSSKRCVYRGAGALCLTSSGSLPATNLNKRKLLTCAPNFYCANVNSSSAFNGKIARFAASLEDIPLSKNHLYGKDANVLGRPLSYIASTDSTTLPVSIRSTLTENLITIEATGVANTGLCQPGKALPVSSNAAYNNPFTQHMSADINLRTDFINQIGSCNAGLFTSARHSSCPVIGSDGNFELFASASLPTDYNAKATTQNACGLESLASTASLGSSVDSLLNYSPFKFIEAKPLSSQTVVEKSLVRDACLRRAGSVCHTDLDCAPNRMHAEQVDYFSLSYFGNAAEKTYHTEYLVCGQSDPKPFASDAEAFKNYDMSKNRCCREVGLDLTTYTADLPTSTSSGSYDAASVGLKMSIAPGIAPNDPLRYSRLASVQNIGTSDRPILTAYQNRDGSGVIQNNSQGASVLTSNQWKTLSEANSETCCGGGWIRKFSDGSNDWTRRDRLYLDVTNFRCINSRSPLITNPSDVAGQYNSASDVAALVDQDYGDYCKDGTNTNGACAQFSVLDSTTDTAPSVTVATNYTTITVNTITPNYSSTNKDYYFKPQSADGNNAVIVNYASTDPNARRNIAIRIPSYVTRAFDNAYTANTLAIRMLNSTGATSQNCTRDAGFNPADHTVVYGGGSPCAFSYNSATRVLKVGANAALGAGAFNGLTVGIEFTTPAPGVGITRTKPGTNSYYLRRLGSLELTGIPQIVHEALYCNDNADRLVPGIFAANVTTSAQFNTISNSFRSSVASTSYYTNAKGLQIEPIFSANDFKCCTPLGKTTKNVSNCCSGYGEAEGSGSSTYTCSLPSGTNLMVYFNSFVSNEGRGTDAPGGGLVEADFVAATGEPLLSSAVNDKIRALGEAYCASGKVRQGGAFGSFEPEPQGGETNLSSRIYNLVDSPRDNGVNSNAGATIATGYNAFIDGFKWNHHLYCDD